MCGYSIPKKELVYSSVMLNGVKSRGEVMGEQTSNYKIFICESWGDSARISCLIIIFLVMVLYY